MFRTVDALRAVATALKKSFSVDPCDVTSSDVTCSCTSKVCHVISMFVPLFSLYKVYISIVI
ncbi:hypothetical protein Bca52824_007119 [Brassica carinata]|uniref:Uncharacterized protein n=1 Tax=Brassica carinata TaxID=52824 RepID=A0A8X7W6X5_BRACI|nr:hypothetical protein Bca52824_007119 [Brassica carinata]